MRRHIATVTRIGSDMMRDYSKGVLVAVLVAVAAKFLSEHYGAPAMLMALLLGIAMNFLSDDPRTHAGIDFTARSVLRIGVALLGVRISWEMLRDLGPGIVICVIAGVVLTIGFGVLLARLLGKDTEFGLLTGGSVAICGASAAMAISAVLPARETSERDLSFTVLGVTILSTLAMILYPMLVSLLGLDTELSGVFLGATIHDVAQVVGAGFSVSDEAGEIAVLVKLIRVSMLAPVVLLLALRGRRYMTGRERGEVQLLPGFLIAFVIFAVLNSLGVIPAALQSVLTQLSSWALLIAIAAVGIKTSPGKSFAVGGPAIVMVVGETVFLALFTIAVVSLV
ncbi:putative sulfate exporter family transporter [Celeribacter sp. PS-C1]|uniref:YeiH family protein n=1 Tax=Celeribacter sp. PS-C1 TaxID=2820813 RepID=UPI001CA58FB6|nr:putative sulfate exporter family transporter [Celeribacter sp. PS-C1]